MSNAYKLVPAAQYALEEIIDAHGLAWTLQALADMCGDKAEHLRANWQDAASARIWDRAALPIARLATRPVITSTEP